MTVSDSTSDEIIAKTMVTATGVNNFPSRPLRVNKGEKTIMTMAVPETTGVATSLQAR